MTRPLQILVAVLMALTSSALILYVPIGFSYDTTPVATSQPAAKQAGIANHQGERARVLDSVVSPLVYDTPANLARAVARPSGYRLAPNTAAAVRTNLHHTVPRQILRELPEDVASNPLVRGRAGAPNRWAIPEDVHRGIHTGAGGGAYNQAWFDELANLGRAPTVDDILRLREQITKQFGIDIYRPGGGGGL